MILSQKNGNLILVAAFLVLSQSRYVQSVSGAAVDSPATAASNDNSFLRRQLAGPEYCHGPPQFSTCRAAASTQQGCAFFQGCHWSGSRCEGSMRDCSSFSSSGDCYSQPGCSWFGDPTHTTSGPGPSNCFSESVTVDVMLDNPKTTIQRIPMKDLKVGDKIRTNKGFQPVYSFGHYDMESSADFLVIHTIIPSQKPLEITKDHLLFVVGSTSPVTAGSIKVGDKLVQADTGEAAVVTKIGSVHKQGLYAPLTSSGTIVVNGVLASSYVALLPEENPVAKWISQHQFVHLLLAPHRMVCTGLLPAFGGAYTHRGMPYWVDYGIQYIRAATQSQQSILVEGFMLLVGISFSALFFLLELLFGASFGLVVLVGGIYCYINASPTSTRSKVKNV